jgi:hypothetical protein
VGHEERRQRSIAQESADEVGEVLVEEHRDRVEDQRSRQRDALLLSARESAGSSVRQRRETGSEKT